MRNVRFQNAVIALVVGLSMLLLLPACFAQDVAGMTGQVTDKSGAAVTGVEVTLRNPSTGFKLTEFTNSIGFYRFAQIPPGQGYEVTFKAKGFNPLAVKDIYLTVATVRTQNVVLIVGARTDVVEVTASASEVTINTTDATIGNTYDVNQLNSLPVQQRMDPIALFSLQPGVTDTGSVTGARVDQNNVTVDGLDVNDFATGGAMQSNTGSGITTGFTIVGHAPIDSVEEFHVTVGGNQADTGPSSGGQFALETKSGTNKFHGNVNEYHRDPDLVANSWFNKDSTPIVPRNHLIQNQFGGNVGGPIILPKLFNGRDRAFFFFDYNNSKIIRQTDTQRTVPLDTFRGDYPGGPELGYIDDTSTPGNVSVSYLPATGSNSVQAIDPAGVGMDMTWVGSGGSSCPTIAGGTGFTNVITSYSCRFPHSNNTVTGDGVNSGGYLFNAPDDDYETNYVGRVDVNLNDKMKMFAVFHIVRENSTQNPNEFAGDPSSNPFVDRTYSFVVGHTWVIGNNKTNRLILGDTVQKYAFPNAFNPMGDVFYEFSDGTGPAMASNLYLNPNSQARRIPIPVLGDDFSWSKGTHTWQFGGTFKDIKAWNQNIADFNTLEVGMGGYVLALCGGGGQTCNSDPSIYQTLRPYNAANASQSLYYAPANASAAESTLQNQAFYDYDNAFGFALGRIANDSSDFNYTAAGTPLNQLTGDQRFYRYYQTQLYAQDTWKITPSLTATYGLTYQKFSVPYETRGLESTEPFTGDMYMSARETQSALGESGPQAVPLISYLLGGQANNGPPLYTPEWRNLAPHVGIVYNPGFDKKLVFNAGASIVYDRTVINAVQAIQDADSYLFQVPLPVSYGISGDPYDTFGGYTSGSPSLLSPRLTRTTTFRRLRPLSWRLERRKLRTNRMLRAACLTVFSSAGAEAFTIVHFCGEKAETQVYPILCRLIGEDRRIAEWLDDAVTETLPGILIRVFNGNSAPLRRAVESAKGDEFARASALAALGYLVRAKGAMSDDDMRAYLMRIRQEAGPRRESVFWMTWVTTVANLGYSDMRSEVEALIRSGFFPEGDFTREEFDLRVACARSDASGLAGFRSDLVAPLEDASAAILSLVGAAANHAGRSLRTLARQKDHAHV